MILCLSPGKMRSKIRYLNRSDVPELIDLTAAGNMGTEVLPPSWSTTGAGVKERLQSGVP